MTRALAPVLRTLPQRVIRRAARRVLEADRGQLVLRDYDGHPMVVRPGTPDEQVLERECFRRDRYLAMLPEHTLGPRDLVVHVGAHIGGFAIHAAERAGTVHAIEASRDTFRLLAANIALNDCRNVVASHLALSDRRGKVSLFMSDSGNWGNSLMPHGTYLGEEVVSAMALADYFAERLITRCHLLVMNCEGAEFPILLAAPPDLLQRVDVIIAHYHCDLAPMYRGDNLVRHLAGSGFDCSVNPDKGRPDQRGTIIARRQ